MKQNITILKIGQEVARYLDIELNGYALIAVVEKEEAQKIINNQEDTIYLQGKLVKIENTPMLEGLEKIKQNYLEDMGMEMTEEEILAIFTPLQLVNYGQIKPNIFLVAILIISFIIVGIICFSLVKLLFENNKTKKEKKETNFKNV